MSNDTKQPASMLRVLVTFFAVLTIGAALCAFALWRTGVLAVVRGAP